MLNQRNSIFLNKYLLKTSYIPGFERIEEMPELGKDFKETIYCTNAIEIETLTRKDWEEMIPRSHLEMLSQCHGVYLRKMSFIISLYTRDDKKARNVDFRVFSIKGRTKAQRMIKLFRH